jgi:hypothetical protein
MSTFLTVCCCCLSSCCDVVACLQSLVRIPDTLLMAMEFLTLYTPSEHNQVMRQIATMQWVWRLICGSVALDCDRMCA